jgi:hypothetical protein
LARFRELEGPLNARKFVVHRLKYSRNVGAV